MSGVICANFGCRENRGKICNGAWHAKCYTQHKDDKFPVLKAADLDECLMDESTMVDEDPRRFKEARDGDHLVTPFQCDDCHFVNVKGRLPEEGNHRDELAMLCIRRAILDSFWSRERSTVRSNRYDGLKFLANQEKVGFGTDSLPRGGPHPTSDDWGIAVAVSMMMHSLDPGKNASRIQYETLRKMRSFFSNFTHFCALGTGPTFMSDDGNSARISYSATNSIWFKRFMQGCHRRMGDVWLPNRAISQYEMKACFEILENQWNGSQLDKYRLKQTATTGCILIAGYFGGLRGEEINKVDAGGMTKHLEESVGNANHPHVSLMLSGTFKKEVGIKLFYRH